MIIDAHLHCTGRERTAEVLAAFDDAGIDIGVLLAPFLEREYALSDPASRRRANEHLARLVAGNRDRMLAFAVVNPAHPVPPTTCATRSRRSASPAAPRRRRRNCPIRAKTGMGVAM